MPSAFLAINNRNGTPQVKRYNGTSASLVGVAVTGYSPTDTYVDANQPVNRVIQFGGANTFFVLGSTAATTGAVFASTDAGNSWSTVFTFSQLTGGNNKSGLNIIYSNGTPTLCFMAVDSAGTSLTGYRSTNGTSWTADPSLSITLDSVGPYSDTVFRSTLYCIATGSASGGSIAYTPGSSPTFASLVSFFTSIAGAATAGLCVFNNNLLAVGCETGNGDRPLIIYDGGSWFQVANLGLFGGVATTTVKCGMFVDGAFLYAFVPGAIPGAWKAYKITSTYSSTDVSSSVLPIALRGSNPNGSRALTWVDGQVNPGADPTKYLLFAPGGSAGVSITLYQWIDDSTTMQNVDSGSTVGDCFCLNKNVEGSTFWTSGENHIELVGRSATSTGTRLQFNLYSGSGGTPTVSVRGFFGTALAEYPTSTCTLTNPSSGSITGGGTINSGVVINNGASTFSVTWDNVTDGVQVGDRTILVLEVFT